MTFRPCLLALLLTAFPQANPSDQIIAEIKTNGKAMEDLAYLSDMIGPRLTGSENLAKAEDWMAGKLKD